MEKDTSVIPWGPYCYTYVNDEYKVCPYYDVIKDRDEQENGWCHFLEKGDIEIGQENFNDPGVVITQGEKEVNKKDVPEFIFGGLLWDQCKECGINDDYKD